MFLYEGFSCSSCDKPFEKSDDIVVCPTCGAPHHRDCWKAEGHCHFESTHGTAEQWSRENANSTQKATQKPSAEEFQTCQSCGTKNSIYAEFCSRCGKELQAADWDSHTSTDANEKPPVSDFGGYGEYRPFHATMPDAGIPDFTDIDGVSAKEIRCFVGSNSPYYVSKFHKLSKKRGCFSWNWAAFLLTPYWLWFRKQHVSGSIVLFFEGVRNIVTAFFLYGFLGITSLSNNREMIDRLEVLSSNDSFRRWAMILYLFVILDVLARFFFGAFGNYLYFRAARKRILKLRGKANENALIASGGTSVMLAIISYVLLYAISTISNFIFL